MRRLEGFRSDPALPPHLGHLQTAATTGCAFSQAVRADNKEQEPSQPLRGGCRGGHVHCRSLPGTRVGRGDWPGTTRQTAVGAVCNRRGPALCSVGLAPGSSGSRHWTDRKGRHGPQLSPRNTWFSSVSVILGPFWPLLGLTHSCHLSPWSLGSFLSRKVCVPSPSVLLT